MAPDEYLKLADVEDRMWYFRALHRHIERELSAAVGARAATVLDAGCGTGGLIRRLAPVHPEWRWTGIDVSEIACDLATKRTAPDENGSVRSQVKIHCGSVTALPFADGAFDAVVSADVLYHIDDDTLALREMARVLRPGGSAIINVPAYRWLWSYHDEAVHGRRRYSRQETIAKLRDAGFVPMRVTFWNTLPFPLVAARRKLLPPPRSGSDVQVFPAPVEAAFDLAMGIERTWLRAFGWLPFGSSIFAVARKP
jgi:SAM-dependent methyltransferase